MTFKLFGGGIFTWNYLAFTRHLADSLYCHLAVYALGQLQ